MFLKFDKKYAKKQLDYIFYHFSQLDDTVQEKYLNQILYNFL